MVTVIRIGPLVFMAPSTWAVTLMPSGVPYLSVGAGAFNLVGAVDDDGYNQTPAG